MYVYSPDLQTQCPWVHTYGVGFGYRANTDPETHIYMYICIICTIYLYVLYK